MSMRTLPVVFINMGGEMLYILDQRLQAHNTEDGSERGVWSDQDRRRVLSDIIRTLFSRDFLDELFTPQPLYSHRALRAVLTRLAHASIMTLRPASMDRLYELMAMAFKHQLLLCPRPRDLLLISYNHLDWIRDFVDHMPQVQNQVDETHRRTNEVYTSLSDAELQLLRQTLLIFFQDMHVRVSLFLRDKVQNPNGRFVVTRDGPVPHGSQVPGEIRKYDSRGREVRRVHFPTGGSYSPPLREGCFSLHGDRVTRLGTSMYHITHITHNHTHIHRTSILILDLVLQNRTGPGPGPNPNPLATEELNLLARLLGGVEVLERPGAADPSYRVNLFRVDPEEEARAVGEAGEAGEEVVTIQAMQHAQASSELARIAEEFTDREPSEEPCSSRSGTKGDDLLALMDTF
ncbi:unnamed protein product [Merluccius merluccius]